MQTAKVTVKTSDLQSIPRAGVTPAEVIVLRKIHKHGANGEVISNVLITGETDPREEFARLVRRYGRKHVEPLFPGHNKVLPATFAELDPPVAIVDKPLPVTPAPADLPPEPEVAATVAVASEPETEPEPVAVKPAKAVKKSSKLP